MKSLLTIAFLCIINFISIAQCPNSPCGPNLLSDPDFEVTSAACTDATLSCMMFYDTSKVQDWWGTALSSGGITQYNTTDYCNPS